MLGFSWHNLVHVVGGVSGTKIQQNQAVQSSTPGFCSGFGFSELNLAALLPLGSQSVVFQVANELMM